MSEEKLIPKMTALQLLEVLDSQIDEDHPAGIMAHTLIRSVVTEIILLNEIEAAALILADIVTSQDVTIELPTAHSQIIKTIRVFQR